MRSIFARTVVAAAFATGTFALASSASAAITVELSPTMKFDVLTASWGVSMPLTTGASNARRMRGRSTHQDLVVTRRPDAFTPSLALSCAGGDDIRSVKVTYTDGATVWQTVLLETVIITTFEQTAGQSRGDSTEKLSFSFTKVKWETPAPPGSRGGNSQGWDLEQNKKAQLDLPVPPQRSLPDDKRSKEGVVVVSAPALVLPPKVPKPTMVASR
jgi:type VI secretion system secreted protein Hcp